MSVARESARAPEPDGGARHSAGVVQPRGRAVEMLALQRAAGNRAVAAAMRSRQAPVRRAPVTSPASAERPTPTPAPSAAAGGGTSSAVAAAAGEPVVQGDFLDDVVGGLAEVGGGVRDRALGWVRDRARSLPGYGLLCVVLGKDVITDAPVARTGAALIDGFLGLIPGSDRIRQNLQESGATEKAGQWLDEEVPKLGLTFDAVKALFRRAWDALDVTDLVDPAGAWAKLVGIFADPVRRLRDFAVGAARKLMEFVFEGALSLAGGAGQAVMGIIRRAGGVFDQIIANPIGFASNLVAAVRGGLGQFLANVGAHLRNGLIGWLTGALGGVIRIPERLDLRGILGMAMDLLGLTWDRVRGRLVRLVGDRVVGALERGAGIISDLAQRGLAAITDRISQFTEGLLDTVLGGIREWVTQSVVGAAITRLISMFNPAGAVVQAVIAIYNTVQFFIERAQQLASLASAVFDSIAAIASGNLSSAITWVEQALSRAVPAVLGFLSRLIGIGDIATPVRNVMQRVQGVIDQALDRVINWIAGLARRAAGALGRGGARDGAAPSGGGDPRATATAVAGAAARLAGEPNSVPRIREQASAIGDRQLGGGGSIAVRGVPVLQRTQTEVTSEPVPAPETQQVRGSQPTNPSSAAAILRLIETRMPTLLSEFERSGSSARRELDAEERAFRDFMVGKRDRPLTAAERARGLAILTNARGLSREYYNRFRDFAWTRLNEDPELAALVGQPGSGASLGAGQSALRIEVVVTTADGRRSPPTERSVDFEHITRVTDQPFRRHSESGGQNRNLTPMLADLNRYYQEALRNVGGAHMFGGDDVEQFIVQHQLYADRSPARRATDFRPSTDDE